MPLPLTGLNAFVYTGLNAQRLLVDGQTVGRKSLGDPILRAPAVLITFSAGMKSVVQSTKDGRRPSSWVAICPTIMH